MINRPKDFRKEAEFFRDKLTKGEHFAFARFSDGEMYILQDKYLELSDRTTLCGTQYFPKKYHKRDHKLFNPEIEEHQNFRKLLLYSFTDKQKGYYKGISCACCVGEENMQWQLDYLGGDSDDITWSNLWVNANYPYFLHKVMPVICKYENILICNKEANVPEQCTAFRVGENCIVNDHHLLEEIAEFIEKGGHKNVVFLFSSVMSNHASGFASIISAIKNKPNSRLPSLKNVAESFAS